MGGTNRGGKEVMECSVKLERMRFYAYHGVMEQERRVGNDLRLRLRCGIHLKMHWRAITLKIH